MARGRHGRRQYVPRHGRLPRRTGLKTVLRAAAAMVAVVAVSATGVAAWAVSDVVGSFNDDNVQLEAGGGNVPDVNALEGGVNLLLVGSDSREGQGDGYGDPSVEEGTLNDVTILVHIAEDHSNAVAVSFPRDMFVQVPECTDSEDGTTEPAAGTRKINTTLGRGGLGCTAQTVQKLTGVDIHYAGSVQFNGVIEMANAIGGVDVCLDEPIRDPRTDLDLPAGNVKLKGKDALQFLRTRHGVGDGSDLSRISNQQVYLSSLMRTVKSADTLGDPVKLYKLAKVAANNMTLSKGLGNPNTMVSIAMALKDIPTENIAFVKYPTSSGELGGQQGEFPVRDAADALMTAVKDDKGLDITGGTGAYGSVEKDADDGGSDSGDSGEDGADKDAGKNSPDEGDTDKGDSGKDDSGKDDDGSSRVKLPDAVTGQSADQQTCSNGNG